MKRLSFTITFGMCFVIMFAMSLFNQAYSHNTAKDSGWTVEEHLSPGDANEDPTTMNVDHTHREKRTFPNKTSRSRISRWYRDFHWHALVHSHDGLEEHQHNVEHDGHRKEADEGVSLPLSTYHAPDYDTAHEGVGPATDPTHRKIRHYHAGQSHNHGPRRHSHSGWHAHPYGNSKHDHMNGSEEFLHSFENLNTSPYFTQSSIKRSVTVTSGQSGVDVGSPVTATDPDGDTLTYSVNSSDFSIGSSTGQLRTAREFPAGNSEFTVRVTANDGNGGSDSIDVIITVTAGSSSSTLSSNALGQAQAVGQSITVREAPALQTSNAQAALPEDVNSDGDIDNDDLLDIALHFGKTPEGDLARYDLDGDGDIDVDDFAQVQAQMTGRAPGAPAAIHTLSDTLAHIKDLDITDPRVQRVVQLLENQLAELAPKKTVLLANYPNPFNPETWIPYRLAKAADVTLTIYAINGQVVRTLALGHQTVGSYVDRARAAYWDGRNMSGEHVASGVYFYHLSAGDYSATRRMVILK